MLIMFLGMLYISYVQVFILFLVASLSLLVKGRNRVQLCRSQLSPAGSYCTFLYRNASDRPQELSTSTDGAALRDLEVGLH